MTDIAQQAGLRAIVNTAALRDALRAVCQVVNQRTPKPVLLNCKLEASENKLTVSATNLNFAMQATITEVQIESTGAVLVDAKTLRSIIDAIECDTVTIEPKEGRTAVRFDNGVHRLATGILAEYPPVAFELEKTVGSIKMNGNDFAALANSVLYAANPEDARSNARALSIESNYGIVTLACCDGHMLGVNYAAATTDGKINLMISANDAKMILSVCNDSEMTLTASENQLLASAGDFEMRMNLIEGGFFPYKDMLNQESTTRAKCASAGLLSVVRSASIFTSEETKKIKVDVSNKGIGISSAVDSGESDISFACKVNGPGLKIGINSVYLSKTLAAIPGDEFDLGFRSPTDLVSFKFGNWLAVIIPMTLT